MTATRLNQHTEVIDGWTVRRFEDGYVEVRKDFEKTITSFSAWGNLYEAQILQSGDSYPVTFTDVPSFRVEFRSSSSGIIFAEYVSGSVSNSKNPGVYVVRPGTASTTLKFTAIATGKV